MSNKIFLGKEEELAEQLPQSFKLNGDDLKIALFKLEDGYYAIDDRCSHDEASLADGDVEDGCKVACPLHGALFDIKSGKNLTLPAVSPVKTYPVILEDGLIYLKMDQ